MGIREYSKARAISIVESSLALVIDINDEKPRYAAMKINGKMISPRLFM